MRLPKRGERGFTLIELLIVVAILGVLAAVIIPNLQRFIGAGEEEAAETELATIQLAVSAMMVDNNLPTLPTGKFIATTDTAVNLMDDFPAPTAMCAAVDEKVYDPDGELYIISTGTSGDKDGYILYQHDINGGDGVPPGDVGAAPLVNYVAQQETAYWYWVDATGRVYQRPTDPTP